MGTGKNNTAQTQLERTNLSPDRNRVNDEGNLDTREISNEKEKKDENYDDEQLEDDSELQEEDFDIDEEEEEDDDVIE